MTHRHSRWLALCALSVMALGGCASRTPKDSETSAAEAMRAQQAASGTDWRACYDEFGTRRADMPYAYCQQAPQYYVVEERRAAPAPSAVEATSNAVTDATAPVDSAAEPATTVVRPTVRAVTPVRPGIGVTRMPVPVPGGMRVLH